MRKIGLLCAFMLALALAAPAGATLVTIGTGMFTYSNGAPIDGIAHNLIWDNDNNGKSVVWLDYTFFPASRGQLMANVAAYGAQLDITLNGYTVEWVDNVWRLPSRNGIEAYGGGINTTEMGHLFYDELGLSSGPTTNEQLNATNFDELVGTAYMFLEPTGDGRSMFFAMSNGGQNVCDPDGAQHGLAIREANVSTVPIPGAVWLLGSGLAGLLACRRRQRFIAP